MHLVKWAWPLLAIPSCRAHERKQENICISMDGIAFHRTIISRGGGGGQYMFVAPLQTEIEPIVLSLIIASSSILAA